jgi:hypothetical protein
VWDAASGKPLLALQGHARWVNSVAYSPDGKTLATASDDKTARVWDRATGKLLLTLTGHTSGVRSVAYSPDGKTLATASRDKTARVWDRATGKLLLTLQGHTSSVQSVAYSPDGKTLATATYEKTARVWDAASGKPLLALQGHARWVNSVAYSPDGKTLATASDDKTTRVWDAASGKPLLTLTGHTSGVRSVAYSPSGKTLATASADGTTRLWDARTGRELACLITFDDGHWLACTPDGYFDGSEGGKQRVSYRIPGTGRVVPVDRFFHDFYRPGLLRRALAGKLEKPTVDLAKSLPPRLRFLSPASGRSTEDGVLEVTVQAQDQGGGVKGPELFANGSNVSSFAVGEPRTVGKTVTRRFRIELSPGVNRLEARSASRNGAWESEPAAVTVRFVANPVHKPTLHLVLFGVSEYPDPSDKLRSPANDVRQVEAVFRKRYAALYKDVRVYSLVDARATGAAVRQTLKKAAGAAEPRDTLVVFLAGHGVMLGQRYYFLPGDFDSRKHDSREEAVRKAGVPADEIGACIAGSRCLKRVLILDTCAAGGAVSALIKAAGLHRGDPDFHKQIEWLSRSKGIWVIAGAAAQQKAGEPEALKHGLLTYTLLAGLNAVSHGPLADKPLRLQEGRTTVTVSEWGEYAREHVSRLAEKMSATTQSARPVGEGDNFPLLPLKDPRK